MNATAHQPLFLDAAHFLPLRPKFQTQRPKMRGKAQITRIPQMIVSKEDRR